ncbi:unnamed protein product [Calypogeia fissa]
MDALALMLEVVSDRPPSIENAPTKKGTSSRREKGETTATKETTKGRTRKGQVASQEVTTPTSVAGANHVDTIAEVATIPMTKPTRQRKSCVAPPFPLEHVKD